VLRLVRAVDGLYESVVHDPDGWSDDRFGEWSTDLVADGDPPSREALRQVRAAIRNARKLRGYWSARPAPADWAMAVDQALGGVGWAPSLHLAEMALAASRDEEAFDEVRRRFRMVNSVPWLEGVSYHEWLESSKGAAG